MRTITDNAPDSFYAIHTPETERFIRDLEAVFRKHKLAIVPTYEGHVSFHDSMRVINLNRSVLDYLWRTGVCFKEPQ